MQIEIKAPHKLFGTVVLPSSKSISNRALVINALAGNDKLPDNVSDCDDTRVMIEWLTKRPSTIDIGAAGTAMRFSSALLAVTEGTHIITGSQRMKNRPIGILVDALRKLGAKVDYIENEGYPPLKITGDKELEGGSLSLPGNVSSQYISALLMIAPVLKRGLTLTLTDEIISRPYINLTISLINDFGGSAGWLDDHTIKVEPQKYVARDYFVESDWSAASYWYEMVALSDDAEIVLPGLFKESYQGDSKVVEIFERLGVKTEEVQGGMVIKKVKGEMGKVKGEWEKVKGSLSNVQCSMFNVQLNNELFSYDFVNQPDLAQTFVVTCCMMDVPFHFTGLQSLKIKETDRIEALKKELGKLGYVLKDRNDSELLWDGERADAASDVSIDTYDDHRMAMAFAPCAIKFGKIKINDPQVVSKSYPGYWEEVSRFADVKGGPPMADVKCERLNVKGEM